MTKKKEIYINVDIEADGLFPGISSMLSFGNAALDIDKNLISTFERNLELLPHATPNKETMDWWQSTPENKAAYAASRTNLVSPADAMRDYKNWLNSLDGIPIFVGYPALYDFKWIDYYTIYFLGSNPFGFSGGIDVKSFALAQLKRDKFRGTTKRNFPKKWFDPIKHTHIAIDDAIEQGAMFINMMRDNLGLPYTPLKK
jgi:3' exoribonuclease, RNase T-like